MDRVEDGERVAADLADWVSALTFVDQGTNEVTALLIDSVAAWAADRGWRVYRRAASVLPLPAPYSHRHSVLDIACARPAGPPVVVEVDRADRQRSVDKLLAEAAAGRIGIWLRWGNRGFAPPPLPVRMVACPVTTRPGRGGSGPLHSRVPASDRPAPRHTIAEVRVDRQADLFADPPGPPG
jgi:hypothetical protein